MRWLFVVPTPGFRDCHPQSWPLPRSEGLCLQGKRVRAAHTVSSLPPSWKAGSFVYAQVPPLMSSQEALSVPARAMLIHQLLTGGGRVVWQPENQLESPSF